LMEKSSTALVKDMAILADFLVDEL